MRDLKKCAIDEDGNDNDSIRNDESIFDSLAGKEWEQPDASYLLKEYFRIVRGLNYDDIIDYKMLQNLMEKLVVKMCCDEGLGKRKRSAVRKTRKTAVDKRKEMEEQENDKSNDEKIAQKEESNMRKTKRSLRQSERSKVAAVDKSKEMEEQENEPKKNEKMAPKQKSSTRKTAKSVRQSGRRKDATQTSGMVAQDKAILIDVKDIIMIDVSDTSNDDIDNDDDSFKSCQSMECEDTSILTNITRIEMEDIENKPPLNNSNNSKGTKHVNKDTDPDQLHLFVVEGPHQGEIFSLSGTVTVGRDPKIIKAKGGGARGTNYFILGKDEGISSTHLKLLPRSSKAGLSIRVNDLGSSNGTLLNGRQVPRNGGRQAFIGDTIKIGESLLKVTKGEGK